MSLQCPQPNIYETFNSMYNVIRHHLMNLFFPNQPADGPTFASERIKNFKNFKSLLSSSWFNCLSAIVGGVAA